MKWLITGGAGFVGSHLADLLVAKGESIVAIDDLSTGSTENIAHLRASKQFRFIPDDVTNTFLLRELVDEADVIVHVAAAVGVRLVVEEPVRTITTNVGATELVLKTAAKKGKRVFIASTSEVYGKGVRVPFNEEDDVVYGPSTKARWSYAASKLIDEFLGLSYWKERGLPVVVGRLFNTVGPRQTGRYGMVIPRFVRQALANEPITVYGDGTQSRCFAHVADVVGAIHSLCVAKETVGRVFNIGGTEEVTIVDLARKIREATRSKSELCFVPYEKAYEEGFEDIVRRVPDLSRIHAAIGYSPSRPLEEIIRDVVAHERAVASGSAPLAAVG